MFVPLHDTNSLTRIKRPIVTWFIILVTCVVYLLFQAGTSGVEASFFAYRFGAIPSVLTDRAVLPPDIAFLPPQMSLVTYSLLHGSTMHLVGNMLFLWVFGDNVEDAMGHVRFFVFYCLCAAVGGYAYVLSAPASDVPLIGASGAISGVVAAYLMLHPKVKLWFLVFGPIPLRLRAQWVLGAWIALQFYNVLVDPAGQTAWTAHVGGLVAGAVLILVFRLPGTPLFDRSPS